MKLEKRIFPNIRLFLQLVTVTVAAISSVMVFSDIIGSMEKNYLTENWIYLLFFLIHLSSFLFRGYYKSIIIISSCSSIVAMALLGLLNRINFFYEDTAFPGVIPLFFVSDFVVDIISIFIFSSCMVIEAIYLRTLFGSKS